MKHWALLMNIQSLRMTELKDDQTWNLHQVAHTAQFVFNCFSIGVINGSSEENDLSTGVLERTGGVTEVLKAKSALFVSLTFALFVLGSSFFIGGANLFPRGSLEESSPGKCLEHTRDWDFNWSMLNRCDLLVSFCPRKWWKEALGSVLEVFPHTMHVCPGIFTTKTTIFRWCNARFSHFDYRCEGQFFTTFVKIESALPFMRKRD